MVPLISIRPRWAVERVDSSGRKGERDPAGKVTRKLDRSSGESIPVPQPTELYKSNGTIPALISIPSLPYYGALFNGIINLQPKNTVNF